MNDKLESQASAAFIVGATLCQLFEGKKDIVFDIYTVFSKWQTRLELVIFLKKC